MNNEEYLKNFLSMSAEMKKLNMYGKFEGSLKPSESHLLFNLELIYGTSAVKVTELSDALNLSPSTISSLLNILEAKGYIKREINKNNRREIFVEVTNEGRKYNEKMRDKIFKNVLGIKEYLGEKDALLLLELMEKIIKYLREKKEMDND